MNDNEKPLWMRQTRDCNIVVCQACKGTRKETVITDDPHYIGPRERLCSYCGGEGLLGKIVTTEYERIDEDNIGKYE